MEIKIISFTKNGYHLSFKLKNKFKENNREVKLYAYKKFIDETDTFTEGLEKLDLWVAEHFKTDTALIFIGATGIAVRGIAKYVKDKYTDPAVICIDEKGSFVISLLSGHLGGANELCTEIAAVLGATPVISTATDLNKKWAVDVWAKKNGLIIDNRIAAKNISSAVLEDKAIRIFSEFPLLLPQNDCFIKSENLESADIYIGYRKNIPKNCLKLIPGCLCLGLGCRKGVEPSYMQEAFEKFIKSNDVDERAIKHLESIDIKKDEPAVIALAKSLNKDCIFFTCEELNALEGNFSSSGFVLNTVKVDNVCERAACKVFRERIADKTKLSGITMALSLDTSLSFDLGK